MPNTTVMQAKRLGVLTCTPGHAAGRRCQRMTGEDVSALVVVDEEGYLAGILSRTDLLRAWEKGGPWANRMVGQYMSSQVVTVGPQHHAGRGHRPAPQRAHSPGRRRAPGGRQAAPGRRRLRGRPRLPHGQARSQGPERRRVRDSGPGAAGASPATAPARLVGRRRRRRPLRRGRPALLGVPLHLRSHAPHLRGHAHARPRAGRARSCRCTGSGRPSSDCRSASRRTGSAGASPSSWSAWAWRPPARCSWATHPRRRPCSSAGRSRGSPRPRGCP